MDKRFIVGSKVFFGELIISEDILIIEDNPQGYKHYTQCAENGNVIYKWARKTKEDFLDYAKRERAYALEFGKFLVPEFAEELGLTIADLADLYEFYKGKIDEKHAYQKTITEAYITNGVFSLTDEQRNEAYKVYKEAREGKGVTDEADLLQRSVNKIFS